MEVTDSTLPLGEVQCCNTELTDCTRKDPADSNKCISGDNDDVKFSYGEAEELCQKIEPTGTWDLCPKNLIENTNQKICENHGCGHDYALVWVKKEICTSNLSKTNRYLLTAKNLWPGCCQKSVDSG